MGGRGSGSRIETTRGGSARVNFADRSTYTNGFNGEKAPTRVTSVIPDNTRDNPQVRVDGNTYNLVPSYDVSGLSGNTFVPLFDGNEVGNPRSFFVSTDGRLWDSPTAYNTAQVRAEFDRERRRRSRG